MVASICWQRPCAASSAKPSRARSSRFEEIIRGMEKRRNTLVDGVKGDAKAKGLAATYGRTKPMPYRANAIANYILDKADKSGPSITPMKITKLVYLAHGWFLGFHKQPLIIEDVQAWRFGPVIPPVYHAFKRFGADQIPSSGRAREFDLDNGDFSKCSAEIESHAKNLIHKVVDVYGVLSAFQLSDITHREGTPWSGVYIDGARDTVIPNLIIQNHYEKIISERSAKPEA